MREQKLPLKLIMIGSTERRGLDSDFHRYYGASAAYQSHFFSILLLCKIWFNTNWF